MAGIRQLRVLRDANGVTVPALDETYTTKHALADGVDTVVEVPERARWAVFPPTNVTFAAKTGASAAYADGVDVVDGSAPMLRPSMLPVVAGSELHLYAVTGGDVWVCWYA